MFSNPVVAVGTLLAFAGGFLIIREAFEDEIWKGILCLLCGLYAIYYALVEMYENKWLAIGLYVAGIAVAAVGRTMYAPGAG